MMMWRRRRMKWVLIFSGEEETFDMLLGRRLQELKSWRFWASRNAFVLQPVFQKAEKDEEHLQICCHGWSML
jgi:hypothetical protein